MIQLIIVLILVGTTLQLAIIKNNLHNYWNENYGHKFGNYCFLCVGFWVNNIIVGMLFVFSDLPIVSAILIAFSVPAGITYLLNQINNGN